jgi:hypothetical protein
MSITDHGKLSTANWIETELEKALGTVLKLQSYGPKFSTADLMHWTGGKLFEFYAFVKILKELRATGRYTLQAKNLTAVGNYKFNGGAGRLDPKYSHVALTDRSGNEIATIWQNIEFTGIGHTSGSKEFEGDYHEADVLVLSGSSPSWKGKKRPNSNELLLVMECKFTAEMPKAYLRNMLGLRRVMSFLSRSQIVSPFSPRLPSLLRSIPATRGNHENYSSHLVLAYSFALSGKDLKAEWARPAQTFGIEYWQC